MRWAGIGIFVAFLFGVGIRYVEAYPTRPYGALPSQSGNSGKYLTTDGTTASWATVSVPSVGNWSFSNNAVETSGSPMQIGPLTTGAIIIGKDNGTSGKIIIDNGTLTGVAGVHFQTATYVDDNLFVLNQSSAKPTCNSAARGALWNEQGGAGVADALYVCNKDAADAYAWRALQ